MKRIAVFASGRGSNFLALAQAVKRGFIKAHLALLVTDNPHSQAIKKAGRLRIDVLIVRREDFPRKEDFEDAIIRRLRLRKIDCIALAGFMRMLSKGFVRKYKNRIINIHPALLPAFKGAHAIKDAFDYGAKVTGVTVHFVDEKMDHGPIILQEALSIRPSDTLASLEARIHRLEHKLYPLALRLFVQGKLSVKGRKVVRKG